MSTIVYTISQTGLVDTNVAFLTAGPRMLSVTQQTPTTQQGGAEKQMGKTVTACLKLTVICLAAHS